MVVVFSGWLVNEKKWYEGKNCAVLAAFNLF